MAEQFLSDTPIATHTPTPANIPTLGFRVSHPLSLGLPPTPPRSHESCWLGGLEM